MRPMQRRLVFQQDRTSLSLFPCLPRFVMVLLNKLGLGLLLFFVSVSARAEPALPFRTDTVHARRLEATRDHIKQEEWADAVSTLQALLDVDEDILVPVRRTAKEPVLWTGVRAEADRLLVSLPAAGREFYEVAQ